MGELIFEGLTVREIKDLIGRAGASLSDSFENIEKKVLTYLESLDLGELDLDPYYQDTKEEGNEVVSD